MKTTDILTVGGLIGASVLTAVLAIKNHKDSKLWEKEFDNIIDTIDDQTKRIEKLNKELEAEL